MDRALYLMGYTAEQAAELEQGYVKRCQDAGRPFNQWEFEDFAQWLKAVEFRHATRLDGVQAQLRAGNAKPHSGQRQRSTHPALRRR